MKPETAISDEYVSRAEFNDVCNQLADALEIIRKLISERVSLESYDFHDIGELGKSIEEIRKDQFI